MDEAEKCYNAALKLDPNYSMAYKHLGSILLTYPDREHEAVECYRKALGCDPNNLWAMNNLSLMLLDKGDYGDG